MIGLLGQAASLIKENPPVATIVASVVAFVGTVFAINLSNRSTTTRLYKQFTEDRAKEDAKRKFESRRDIYLNATDAVATAGLCIGRLSDIERTSSEILSPLLEKAGQIAKVHIVASPATSEAVAELQSTIAQAVIALSFARIPIEVERRRLNELKPSSSEEEIQKRRSEIELLRILIVFGDQCLAHSIVLANLSAKAILLIRVDLSIDTKSPYEPRIGDMATRGRIVYRNTTDTFMQGIKEAPIQWPSPTPQLTQAPPMPQAPPSAPPETPPADTRPPRPE